MEEKDVLAKLTKISETLKIIDKTKVNEQYLKNILNDVSEILEEANHPLPFSQRTRDRFDSSEDFISDNKKGERRTKFYKDRIADYIADMSMEVFFAFRDDIYPSILEILGCKYGSDTDEFFDLLENLNYSTTLDNIVDTEDINLSSLQRSFSFIFKIPFKYINENLVTSSLENYISHDNIKHFIAIFKDNNKSVVTCRFDFDPILGKKFNTFSNETLNNLIDNFKHLTSQIESVKKDLESLKSKI